MALYLGSSEKLKIDLNGVAHCLNLLSKTLIINGIMLLSSEGHVLKDTNGLYITTKEEK